MQLDKQSGGRLALRWAIGALALIGTSCLALADQPGDFDLYVLSLSWSPDYCASHRDDTAQCAADQHFGLMVHGLWPQFATPRPNPVSGKMSNWPANCPAARLGTPPAAARDVWPSLGLFRHEWQVHGSCSALAPADFVDLTNRLRQRFQVPAPLQPAETDQTIGAADLRSAILGSNPGLPAGGVMLFCRKNRLAEIRLCLSRGGDHAYTSCPLTMAAEDNCPTTIQVDGLDD